MTSIQLSSPTNNIPSVRDFYELTRKGCALKFFPIEEIAANPNSWTKLADIWEKLIDETDLDIFRDAAYFIKWGIPAKGPSPAYQTLVEEVSKALLQNGPASEAWIHHEHCASVIYETAREFNPWDTNGVAYSFSDWHHRYTSYKMLLRILDYRKGHITACKKYASSVRYYENRIIKLLPNAKNWPTEYWLNENKIIDELNKVCPYNYRTDLSSYNALLNLTRSPKRMPTSRDWGIIQYASNVKVFSECWMKAIWPTKTEAIIVQYFLLAEKIASETLEAPWLCHSIGFYDPVPGID